jgi:hypothetical protein
MREFQTTRTLRASSGKARPFDASSHHAVSPPSSLAGFSLGGAENLKTRSHEAQRLSICVMLRFMGLTYNNHQRNWQQNMCEKSAKNCAPKRDGIGHSSSTAYTHRCPKNSLICHRVAPLGFQQTMLQTPPKFIRSF